MYTNINYLEIMYYLGTPAKSQRSVVGEGKDQATLGFFQ